MNKAKDNPATVYLNSLRPSGRRSMRCVLVSALKLLKKRQSVERYHWQTLTYADVIMIKMKLQEQGKASNTINLTLAAIRGVMRSALHLGLIDANILMQIQSVKRVSTRTKVNGKSLTRRECKRLIQQCIRDKSAKGVRDAAILSVMLTTGLRRNEVVKIKVSDFDQAQHELTIYCSKTNSERVCPVISIVEKRVKSWLKIRGNKEGALFCPILKNEKVSLQTLSTQAIYSIVIMRASMGRMGRVVPHDLRRTYVTRLLDADVDINIVRQLVGHQDIKTTAKYDYRVTDAHMYMRRVFNTI